MTVDLPLTISENHKNLKDGVYSTVDLVKTYLDRINEFDKEINSFITVTDNYALKQAEDIDRVISKNSDAFEEYPLLGAVFSIKDLYLTKGIRTTAGSNVLENYIAQYSSTVIKKLEKAGAVIIGKVNCDAWAHGASGENSDFGPTKNPWSKDYVPGGSSSGSAASVSANFALASMGTDTGGSIRQPASFTNLVGMKPTYGAVSRYGVVAMASSLDTMGHFSRTAEDSQIIFNVTRGQDGKDATVKEATNDKDNVKDKYVVGIPKEYFVDGVDKEVIHLIEQARKELEKLGIETKEISLPHTKYAISVYYIIMSAEVSSNLARYTGVRYGKNRDSFGQEAKRRIMLGSYVLSSGYYDAYYLRAMKVRTKISQNFDDAFKEVDAIFAPVSPTPPFKMGEKATDPLQMYLADIFTAAVNLSGIPSIAIPAGFTDNGLPVGFQLMGPKFSENRLFDIAKKYQSVTDWHRKVPTLL